MISGSRRRGVLFCWRLFVKYRYRKMLRYYKIGGVVADLVVMMVEDVKSIWRSVCV